MMLPRGILYRAPMSLTMMMPAVRMGAPPKKEFFLDNELAIISTFRSAKDQGQGVMAHLVLDAFHIQSQEGPIFVYDLAPGHIHHHIGAVGGKDQVFRRVVAG